MVIAEAGISSWYDYYRKWPRQPWGYPGEDLDTLTEFTYSRALLLENTTKRTMRPTKELSKALIVRTETITSSGMTVTMCTPQIVSKLLLPLHMVAKTGTSNRLTSIKCSMLFHYLEKHPSSHNGAHVYMNAWQSIDFEKAWTPWFVRKLP